MDDEDEHDEVVDNGGEQNFESYLLDVLSKSLK